MQYLADGETVTYSYDAAGNRTQMADSLGTTSTIYDDLYRVITVTNPFTGSVGYEYDLVGNRTGLVYPDGKVVTNTYNLDNQMIQVEDWDGGLTTYAYDNAGQLITTTLPNGVQTVNVYDTAGQLLRLTHTNTVSGNLQADFQYELDSLGNRQVATETLRLPNNSLQTTIINYSYDPLIRLTGAVHTGAITATYAYVYDAVGNMEAYTETVGTDTAIVTRQFDNANQLLISTDVLSGTTSFYYDGNGSLTQILPPGVGGPNMAGALRYGYNQRNLIITTTAYITTAGWANQVTYRYDGDDGRVQQVDHTGSQPITASQYFFQVTLSRPDFEYSEEKSTQENDYEGRLR